jgi:hypothetical protein
VPPRVNRHRFSFAPYATILLMSDPDAWIINFLDLGFTIPRNEETSAQVKRLFDAGWIKAEQIEDTDSGRLIWVCNGLSDESKKKIFQLKAQKADAQMRAQLQAIFAPFMPQKKR